MFGPKHQILELAQMPRERGALQSMLNEARHQRRIRRIKYIVAAVLCFAAIIVFLSLSGGSTPASAAIQHIVFIPLSIR